MAQGLRILLPLLFFFYSLQFGSQVNQGFFMFEENGDQNRLKRPGSRSTDSGLHMKSCLFKEPVEKLLIFFSQTSPKLPPLLGFLFQNPAKRKDRPAHNSCSVSVPARRSAAFRHAGVTRVRSLINLKTAGHCSKRIAKSIQCLPKVFAPSKWRRYKFFNLRFAICNSVTPFAKIILGPSSSKLILQASLEN